MQKVSNKALFHSQIMHSTFFHSRKATRIHWQQEFFWGEYQTNRLIVNYSWTSQIICGIDTVTKIGRNFDLWEFFSSSSNCFFVWASFKRADKMCCSGQFDEILPLLHCSHDEIAQCRSFIPWDRFSDAFQLLFVCYVPFVIPELPLPSQVFWDDNFLLFCCHQGGEFLNNPFRYRLLTMKVAFSCWCAAIFHTSCPFRLAFQNLPTMNKFEILLFWHWIRIYFHGQSM